MEAVEGRSLTPQGLIFEATSERPEILCLTPQDAQSILDTCQFPRQRHLRQNWIEELSGYIHKGSWEISLVQFVKCEEDGKTYLVDGYHRLNAIVHADKAGPLMVFRHTFDTFHRTAQLYARLDRGLARTTRDALIALDIGGETDVAVHLLQSGIAASKLIKSKFLRNKMLTQKRDIDESVEDLLAWKDQLHAYITATSGGTPAACRRLRGSSIMAVGLVLFKHQPEKAKEFFSGVAQADRLEQNTPLHTFLINILLNPKYGERKAGPAVVARAVAVCWNAFLEERPLSYVRVMDPNKPILLRGTPFTDYRSRAKINAERTLGVDTDLAI